jgi:isochorismate synthase
VFRLRDGKRSVIGKGLRAEVERGGIESFAGRVGAFFAANQGGPRVVMGALPFDRSEPDYLFQPEIFRTGDGRESEGQPISLPDAVRCAITPVPAPSVYRDAVAACLEIIADTAGDAEPLAKVVLSRSLELFSTHDFDATGLLRALARDPSVTVFSTLLPAGADVARPLLVGATPELLVSKKGGEVVSHPLAGSARRYADPAADRDSAATLETSEKDRREHQAVVDADFDALTPYCSELNAPEGTTLRSTASMWHLGTRIVGRLKDAGTPVAELACALHPTPAVCGLPRERAAGVIGQLEGYDRGFYAGAVGWADEQGDGEWYVSIRSARLAGRRATLYAGAGIVAGSDPAGETDETSAKFVALLSALGIDEHGRALRERAA